MSIHSLLKLDPTTRIPAMNLSVQKVNGEVSAELAVDDGFTENSFDSTFYEIKKDREFTIKSYWKNRKTSAAKLYR